MHRNPYCDGDHCSSDTGQVRLLPTGGDGNAILCRSCFNHEMRYRKDRNSELGHLAYDVPNWETLKIYDTGD